MRRRNLTCAKYWNITPREQWKPVWEYFCSSCWGHFHLYYSCCAVPEVYHRVCFTPKYKWVEKEIFDWAVQRGASCTFGIIDKDAMPPDFFSVGTKWHLETRKETTRVNSKTKTKDFFYLKNKLISNCQQSCKNLCAIFSTPSANSKK